MVAREIAVAQECLKNGEVPSLEDQACSGLCPHIARGAPRHVLSSPLVGRWPDERRCSCRHRLEGVS